MPNFLSGISEANTGLEYIVDGTTTEKWLNKAIRFNDQNNRNGIRNSILEYERIFDQEASRRAKNLNLKYSRNMFAVENDFNDAMNYSNNYFGQFQSINNGWFRDRWYREFLDFKLYDDNGMPIVDDTIRIKNLEGNVAKDRVEAYWNYYIQSQGVGKRNVSGIWRDQDKDAIAMFGYLTKDIAEKANFIAFKDKDNGEIKTIAIKKQNTNNMFYYKTQDLENEIKFNNGDTSVRHTLAEEKYDYTDKNGHHKGEGFVSWVTNYEVMSRYRDNLLKPGLHGKRYEMYFASDESGKERIAEIDLGDYESVSENGKTFSQAPTKIEKVITKDKDGNIKETIEMVIFDQFNGVNVG
ncbi:Uncharacterised protein [Mycoplasmopsis maculosa]|uniref:Uncharacterized protein n=1 Tax=Mycoplasmopsis maculosa TaxID=114885 RepID=A0A449B4W6_9BACT|nr:hypothetical protein [Mycoplasmopsis maculosa]VEU75647.1 Uncharacterised protein [Mycoplasmopsis maculosa]